MTRQKRRKKRLLAHHHRRALLSAEKRKRRSLARVDACVCDMKSTFASECALSHSLSLSLHSLQNRYVSEKLRRRRWLFSHYRGQVRLLLRLEALCSHAHTPRSSVRERVCVITSEAQTCMGGQTKESAIIITPLSLPLGSSHSIGWFITFRSHL